jgi:5-methylcytosine-specific restriction endonuclease McrA
VSESAKAKMNRKAYMERYRAAHKEEYDDYNRDYYLKNRVEIRRKQTDYNDTHTVQIKAQQKVWREAHKEEQAEYHHNRYLVTREDKAKYDHDYYLAHKEAKRDYNRKWWLQHSDYPKLRRFLHPDTVIGAERRHRARLAGAEGTFTYEEFLRLCEDYGFCCVYCGQELPLTPNHMTPLAKSGTNYIDNIISACASCNSRKQARTFDEYLQTLSRTEREDVFIRRYVAEHSKEVQELLSRNE